MQGQAEQNTKKVLFAITMDTLSMVIALELTSVHG